MVSRIARRRGGAGGAGAAGAAGAAGLGAEDFFCACSEQTATAQKGREAPGIQWGGGSRGVKSTGISSDKRGGIRGRKATPLLLISKMYYSERYLNLKRCIFESLLIS